MPVIRTIPNKKPWKSDTFSYVDLYQEYPNKSSVSLAQFKKILTTFNDAMIQSSIDTGRVYQLPHNCGAIGCRKKYKKNMKRAIDWVATKKEGTLVRKNNLHTSGYVGMIVWDKESSKHYGRCDRDLRNLIEFQPCRPHKRLLARAIMQKNTINSYYDI